MRVLHSTDDRINKFYDVCTALESALFEYFIPTYRQIVEKSFSGNLTDFEIMQFCNVKAKGLAHYLMANPPDFNDTIASPDTYAMLKKDWEEDVAEEADWCLGDGSYMSNQMRRIILPALRLKHQTIDEASEDKDYITEVKDIVERLVKKFNGKDVKTYSLDEYPPIAIEFAQNLVAALSKNK